jgi:selenocysteine lyase/cysteine desulfurase
MDRRTFLGIVGAASPVAWRAPAAPRLTGPTPGDEAFWREIRAQYRPPADYLDFDQANTGPTPAVVFDAYVARARRMSHAPAERFGALWEEMDREARPALAAHLGAPPRQVAFVDSATVALNTVLHGFPLQGGDEVLVTDHEYPDMVETVLQRARRDGIVMRTVRVPGPDEPGALLATRVAEAITPRTRLLLVSHVSAWNGEVLPVEEVTRVARARGVAVLVDAAQSLGVLDVDFARIGCDFLGASLHKWLGAPVASGVLVMRPEHAGAVRPLHPPSWDSPEHPMDPYEWSGTFNVPARAAVADALAFQARMGIARKRARLRFLGERWMDALAAEPRVRVLTPRDPARSFGVGAFRVDGIPSADLARHLRRAAGVLVQDKAGRHSPFASALRVSPPPFATPAEVDRLVAAVRQAVRTGVPAP